VRREVLRSTVSSLARIAVDPFGIVTWPFHSERATQSCRLCRSISVHSNAMISPHRKLASPPSNTARHADESVREVSTSRSYSSKS
jgi:hypothetical protein